ncbi:hypothetical protein QBC37DRAFT_465732 [Rhypophila decipiens]|uniref:Uncharacterized protein n=1 Tax=Rhypophila decipiens TaxID=261697 RepID=A0AAN7B754_9PEZI|nr:hypothetical protein QBC37DRAFT_465732 [Rhypophila decipiens]
MSIFAERILPTVVASSSKMISTISTTISSLFKRVISANVSQRMMIHADSPKDLAPICTQRRDKGAKRPKRSVQFKEPLEQGPSQEQQDCAKPRNASKAAYEGDWHPDQWFGLVPNPPRRIRSILKKTGPVVIDKRKPYNACQSVICQKCRKGGSRWFHKHGGLEMLNDSLKKREVEKPKVEEPKMAWECQLETTDVRYFVCFALIFTGICLMAADGTLSRLFARPSGIEDDFWEC